VSAALLDWVPHSRPWFGHEEEQAVAAAVASLQVAAGPKVTQFEGLVAQGLGRRFGVAASSGSNALTALLLGLGVGPGDEVVIPAYVCTSLHHAVTLTGATPVEADAASDTPQLDLGAASAVLNENTRAVVLPHLFGLAVDWTPWASLNGRVGVIEDVAQAIGGRFFDGAPLGGRGRFAVASFYATKVMASGHGGMILGDDEGVLNRARSLIHNDRAPMDRTHLSARMNDLEAALGLIQWGRLPDFVARRRAIAARFDAIKFNSRLIPLPRGAGDLPFRYVVQAEHRAAADDLIAFLATQKVAAARPVERGHEIDAAWAARFPNAARWWATLVSIPCFPALDDEEQRRVILAVQRWCRR